MRQDPRRTAGLENPKSKMAFRVCFYPDRLKTFIMESSFLERFDPGLGKIDHFMESDTGLLKFGIDRVAFFLTGKGFLPVRENKHA